MATLFGRTTDTNIKMETKRKISKSGLAHKENFGLHPSKRITPATPTVRKPLGNVSGNVSNTIKKPPGSKTFSVTIPDVTKPDVKRKVESELSDKTEEEWPDIEYMPIAMQSVKEPFPQPKYFDGLLDILTNPSLFASSGKVETPDDDIFDQLNLELEIPLKSTNFGQTSGFFQNKEDLTLSLDIPNLDDIII